MIEELFNEELFKIDYCLDLNFGDSLDLTLNYELNDLFLSWKFIRDCVSDAIYVVRPLNEFDFLINNNGAF